ncbi:unnamed protein product (macronuclear) [Paramecium tetraurelia]|uniref:Uncharacterized protein n=1 Tax=Paramecium tetraurelia TaxID=5888 RepID=A0BZP7_PARTE|nr:uncharacterized protein GSPATT00005866001 [Paramecium tetraurelia]CAK64014.1 unnamed protein product [Paramecium tetraurelia]|eukprot:XP_001431412.1 hypothetical protein (macronuclear) [Paramecium tetraurelia strain d4-2]
MNQADQSQQSQDSQSTMFSYDPKLFSLLQKALLLVSKQKQAIKYHNRPQNPIKFVADYMKQNRDDDF